MSTHFVPGAPLADGTGWKLWYSHPGEGDFNPAPIQISRGGVPDSFQQDWQLLDVLPGLKRRIGVLTVRLDQPAPGSFYEITIPEAAQSVPFRWRSLPNQLPEEGVAFLLGSCFWRDNDENGSYSAAVRDLTKRWQPAFKLLAGDQVYQDWPAAAFVNKTPFQLYADRYAEYWGDPGYQEVLRACPNMFMCDDHEYWNDFPERQVHLSRTWTAQKRQTFTEVAVKLYQQYQVALNPGTKYWYSFQIGPVSFFAVDTRTERDRIATDPPAPVPHFLKPAQWQDLTAWVEGLRGPGVLIIGQPVYQKDGDWKDHSLSNFPDDYGRLCQLIAKSHRGENAEGKPHQILMLSGDIHTGRYSIGTIAGIGGEVGEVHEFVASAASRVGPYPHTARVSEPPTKFQAVYQGAITSFQVDMRTGSIPPGGPRTYPTTDNNIGMVQMFPGTNGRVRFQLSIWRVRPHDNRNWWDRLKGTSSHKDP
ncbi:MAG TPA: alkaline phosphatase D family protein [Methylomirabilota bacterium]|nr:alkaline phosphatase D family protein [Methylomirabilota bacterium]